MSHSQVRIAGALLLGAILIAGTLVLRTDTDIQQKTQTSDVAVVTKAPPRSPINTLDENNDGVPDWQEALLVTEALQVASTTETYKTPDTLTEQFALTFFKDMVRAKNYGAFGDSQQDLVTKASASLAQKAADTLISQNDIQIANDDSLEYQKIYTEQVAVIINTYSQNNTESETQILEQALRTQSEQELVKLDPIIGTYTQYLEETKKLPVPPSLLQEHLNLLNSYQAIREDIKAMRSAFSDPMLTLIRMKRYQDDVDGLYLSITGLYTKAMQNGVQWDKNSPVFEFITFGDTASNN